MAPGSSRGLRPFDEDSLQNALFAAAGEHHSSNGEGLSDIDALKAGQDPNGSASAGDLTPAFGCSSSGSADLLMGSRICFSAEGSLGEPLLSPRDGQSLGCNVRELNT